MGVGGPRPIMFFCISQAKMRAGLIISLLLTTATLTVAQSLVVSTSGSCANTEDETCVGSRWGNCCSQNGFCGVNATYCGGGCQSGFGACYDNADKISVDGGCGSDGAVCLGSIFGNCCSSKGFCGHTDTYCGTGCQDAYGLCGDAASNATVSTTIAALARPSTTIISTTSSTVSATPVSATTTPDPTSSTSKSTATSAGAQSHSVTNTTGFKAGMAILAVVLAVIIGALIWFFFVRRPQRQQSQDSSPPVYQPPPGTVIHEKSGISTFTHAKPSTASSQSELGGFPVSELPANDLSRTALVDERAAAGYDGSYRGH